MQPRALAETRGEKERPEKATEQSDQEERSSFLEKKEDNGKLSVGNLKRGIYSGRTKKNTVLKAK